MEGWAGEGRDAIGRPQAGPSAITDLLRARLVALRLPEGAGPEGAGLTDLRDGRRFGALPTPQDASRACSLREGVEAR
jgi:hypothetical protein